MSEYVLSYNYITAPFMYKKFQYHVPKTYKRYWFSFSKAWKSYNVWVANLPVKFDVTPYRMVILNNPDMIYRESSSFTPINSFVDELDRDSSELFKDKDDNRGTIGAFIYKTNTRGTEEYEDIIGIFKTSDKGLFTYEEDSSISDKGKYRNVFDIKNDSNIYKVTGSGINIFAYYQANKSDTKETEYYNDEIVSAYKSVLNSTSIYNDIENNEKLIDSKSIIHDDYYEDLLAGKDRLSLNTNFVLSTNAALNSYKVAKPIIPPEIINALKFDMTLHILSGDANAFKDNPKLNIQEPFLAEKDRYGRNIISDKYSYNSIFRDNPGLDIYISENSRKKNLSLKDLYKDLSFKINKQLFFTENGISHKTEPYTWYFNKDSFGEPEDKHGIMQYYNHLGSKDNLNFSIFEGECFGGLEGANAYLLYKNDLGFKGMPYTNSFDWSFGSKSVYDAIYNKEYFGNKDGTIYVTDFETILGIPQGKDIFDLKQYLGKKSDSKYNVFDTSDGAGGKKHKDVFNNEIYGGWKKEKDSILDSLYALNFDKGKDAVYFKNFLGPKQGHISSYEKYNHMSEKIEKPAPSLFTSMILSKNDYHAETLYKVHGWQSVYNESFMFRPIYRVVSFDDIIMMIRNRIDQRYVYAFEHILSSKEGKYTDTSEQYHAFRTEYTSLLQKYFNYGANKSSKDSNANNGLYMARNAYDLFYQNEITNSYKAEKISNILASDISGLRTNPSVIADETANINVYKNLKPTINNKSEFLYRPYYDASYVDGQSNSHKSAFHTDALEDSYIPTFTTGSIGRYVFVYDASIIHKMHFNIINDDQNMFTYKKIPNIYVYDKNDSAHKIVVQPFESSIESIYKMYTDTFVNELCEVSVYKKDRDIYTEYAPLFAYPKYRSTYTEYKYPWMGKYYDVSDNAYYSDIFLPKKVYNIYISDKIPYVSKPDLITNFDSYDHDIRKTFPNTTAFMDINPYSNYVYKKIINTNTPNDVLFIDKIWYNVSTDNIGIDISRIYDASLFDSNNYARKIFGEGAIYENDYINKTIGKSYINDDKSWINPSRKGIDIKKDMFYGVIKTRYGIPYISDGDIVHKRRYEISPEDNIEKIDVFKNIIIEDAMKWIKKKDAFTFLFSNLDISVFKNNRDTYTSASEKWIDIPKYAHDVDKTELYVDTRPKPVQIDDSNLNRVFRNMFSVEAWNLINSNAGSLVGISVRAFETHADLNRIVVKMLKHARSHDDILSVSSLARNTNESNSLITASIFKELSVEDESMFTYKIAKDIGEFVNIRVAKGKLKTFVDNYELSVYKNHFNIYSDPAGVSIHKNSVNINVDNNGIGIHKKSFKTVLPDTSKWLSKIKDIFLTNNIFINKGSSNINLQQDTSIIRRGERKIFISELDALIHSRQVSEYENIFVTTKNKVANEYENMYADTKMRNTTWYENIYSNTETRNATLYENVYSNTHEKITNMFENDFVIGHGKSIIENFTSAVQEIKRLTSVAAIESVDFSKTNTVSVISLDKKKDGYEESYLIPVSKLYSDTSYAEIDSVLKKYKELEIDKDDFGNWAWVYEPENPFNKYNDIRDGIDELLLPEKDYRYENFEDIVFNRKTNRPRNPVKKIDEYTWICKYPTRHPFKNTHPDVGIAYVGEKKDNYYGVNTGIMQEIFLKYYQIWQQNLYKFATMSMHEASRLMLEYIYSWIILYYPPENLEQALRVFRQIRWFSECAVINNSQYIIRGEWTDLKMLDIPNDLEDNDTMYYDEKLFAIRNTPESYNPNTRTEASVEFHYTVWKDTFVTFSVLVQSGSMNLYIDDVLVDTISTTRRFNKYPVKFTGEETTIRFEKTAENNVDNFLIADVRLKDMQFGNLEVEFDPKLKAGNKALSLVADKMIKWADVYDDVAEAYEELQKKNIGIAVTVDMMKEYLELHHKNKNKGKRLTIKKT